MTYINLKQYFKKMNDSGEAKIINKQEPCI